MSILSKRDPIGTAPWASRVLCAGSFVLVLSAATLLGFGSYTRKERMQGVLDYAALQAVYAPAGGIVTGRAVAEGETIRAGQTLFKLRTAVRPEQVSALRHDVADQLAGARAALHVAEATLAGLDGSASVGTGAQRLAAEQVAIVDAHMDAADQAAQHLLDAAAEGAGQEVDVQASEAGTVLWSLLTPGARLANAELCLTMVTPGTPLVAELFGSGSVVARLAPGMPVGIEYDGYSARRFGAVQGRITAIDRVQRGKQLGEADIYRVTVALPDQNRSAMPVRAGMGLRAVVPVTTRRLYQWLLDPAMDALRGL